jgi:serine/threonine-protein kinase
VVTQSPAPGTKVDSGSRVKITVSSGPEKVKVPNVVDLDSADAAAALRAAGLGVSRRTRKVDSEADDGAVIDQRPAAGTQVEKGRDVVIVVGRFEPPPPQQGPPPASPTP